MKKHFTLAASTSVLVAAVSFAMAHPAYADNNNNNNNGNNGMQVVPFEFVGTASDCSPFPAGSQIVGATWADRLGVPAPNDKDRQALVLSKNGPTADCSAAGATISNVKGIKLTELGFDARDHLHCGAGAPRFNIVASDGFHFGGGCSNATKTANTPTPGWSRYRINPANPAQMFPVIAPGATIVSISIIFDEGTDVAPDNTGLAILDNIDVNGKLVGSGRSGSGGGRDD